MNNKLNVYRASAGSGKTFQLTAQFLSLLLIQEHADPRRILAVTFTNKATYEMKTRIMQHLYDIASKPLTEADNMREKLMEMTQVSADVLQTRAQRVLHQLLHNYDDFYVQTIDSFLQRLLQNLAHELGLMSNYSVNLDDEDVIARAVDALIAQIDERPDVMNWLVGFVTDNIESGRKWDFTQELRAFAKNLTQEVFLSQRGKTEGLLTNENINDYRKKIDVLQTQCKNRIMDAARGILTRYDDFGRFSRGGNLESVLRKMSEGTFENISMGTYEGFLQDENKLIRKSDQNDAALCAEVGRLWQDVTVFEALRQENLKVINTCVLCKRNLNPFRLLNEIDVLMTAINSENNRFQLSRTPLLFNELVGDDDTSFVYERAGIQYEHVMIDEFQDTSRLQWKNFKALINNSLSAGHSNMIVGDVKQSIYRWRNGDWGILQYMANDFPKEQYHEEPLRVNRRSGEQIVNFNKVLFPSLVEIFAQHIDDKNARRLRQMYSDVEQIIDPEKGNAYVRVAVGDGENWPESAYLNQTDAANLSYEEQQLREMGNIIRDLHEKGCSLSQMGILVRFRFEADAIQRYFAQHYPEIRLISDDAFVYGTSAGVTMLMAALKVLHNPKDVISEIYLAEKYQTEILGNQIDKEDVVSHAADFLPETFTNHTEALRRLPLYELCERLIHILSLEKFSGQELYLMSFLDQVVGFIDEYHSDLATFITYWNETLSNKSMPSEKIDGVQIMTIHKAKGLAFPTLFVPFFGFYPLEPNEKNFLWVAPAQIPFNEIPLLPIKVEKRMERSLFAEEYNEEKFQTLVEALNMLYVALTRPKKNMFLWLSNQTKGRAKKGMDTFMTTALLGNKPELPCMKEYGKAPILPSDETKEEDTAKSKYVNPFGEIPREKLNVSLQSFDFRPVFRQSNESVLFLSDDEELQTQQSFIDNGKLLHYIFSTINSMQDIHSSVQSLISQGLVSGLQEAEKLAGDVEKWIHNAHCESWFDGNYKLYNECEIIKPVNDGILVRRRPDRVIMRENEVIVIDFKFGKPIQDYAHKVQEYVDLLSDMGYKNVRGYLWYIYLNRIEQV